MIQWKDFILDDVCGPVLSIAEIDEGAPSREQVRRKRNEGHPSTSKDARVSQIQETRQEQRPARMVGHCAARPDDVRSRTNLDSSDAHDDMEVDRSDRVSTLQRRGEV